MNAAEIRQELQDKFKYTEEQVGEIKGITALREEYERKCMENGIAVLESENDLEDNDFIESGKSEIDITSPDWTDYIMSLFTKEELVDIGGEKRPNVHGLRRVAQICFGELVSNTVDVIKAPDSQNGYCATVQCKLLFWSEKTSREKVVSDVADVSVNNCEAKYARHASSTAATKAEARALRKLLQLRLISSEESTPENLTTELLANDYITETQVVVMDRLCKMHNINVIELVNSGEQHYNNIKTLKESTAHRLLSILNDDSKRKEFLDTRPTLIGYNASWRELFGE